MPYSLRMGPAIPMAIQIVRMEYDWNLKHSLSGQGNKPNERSPCKPYARSMRMKYPGNPSQFWEVKNALYTTNTIMFY